MVSPEWVELEREYASRGIWIDGYIPLFLYLEGLRSDDAHRGTRCFSVALVTNEEFVICECQREICDLVRRENFLPFVGRELGRIRKSSIAEVRIFPPSAPEFASQVIVSRMAMKQVNKAWGQLLPGKLKLTYYKCIIGVRCIEGDDVQDVYFAIPTEPRPPSVSLGLDGKDIAVDLLPDPIQDVVKKIRNVHGLLKPLPTDPEALAIAHAIGNSLAKLALATRP